MSDFISLFSSLIPIVIIVLLFLWVKKNVIGKQESYKHEGAIMIIEVGSRLSTSRLTNQFYGYSQSRSSSRLVANVMMGRVISQHGSQAKIALNGKWERVDANTIRGNSLRVFGNHRITRDFTVGHEFPFSPVLKAIMGTDTNYARVVQLYIPGDVSSV